MLEAIGFDWGEVSYWQVIFCSAIIIALRETSVA